MSTATFSIPIRRPGVTGRLGSLGRPVFSLPMPGPGATGRLGQAEAGLTAELESYYQDVRAWCMDKHGPDFCNNILPMSIYNAMGRAREGFGMPWWAWLIVGILAAKFLRL